ncbi:hypothetical protein QOK74_08380 [Staphylococcus saprophyticus]|nr:hypothetical protein [Staphylococcus saprophyticus]MDK1672888.1 hypothetical protein [Staphylococcus saprophyticus]
MKLLFIIILAISVFLPEIIKFARIKHMQHLGYKYKNGDLVKIKDHKNE